MRSRDEAATPFAGNAHPTPLPAVVRRPLGPRSNAGEARLPTRIDALLLDRVSGADPC